MQVEQQSGSGRRAPLVRGPLSFRYHPPHLNQESKFEDFHFLVIITHKLAPRTTPLFQNQPKVRFEVCKLLAMNIHRMDPRTNPRSTLDITLEVPCVDRPAPPTLNPEPETLNPKPQTPNPKPEALNPKLQTPNSKPQPPNSKPQT